MPASVGGSAPCAQQQAPVQGILGPGCFRLVLTDGARRDSARWAAGAGASVAGASVPSDIHDASGAAGPANPVTSTWGLHLLALGGRSAFRGAPLLASISLAAGARAGGAGEPGPAGAAGAGPVVAGGPAPAAAGAAASTGWAARSASAATCTSSPLRPAQPLFSLADATANRRGRQQQQLQPADADADANLDMAGAEALIKEMMGQAEPDGSGSSGGGGRRSRGGGRGTEALPSASRAVRWAADAAAAEGAGGGLLDGGDEEDTAAEAEAERALGRVQCGFCGRRLGRRGARDCLLCDCCHRPFHTDCCRYRGVSTRRRQAGEGHGGSGGGAEADGGWFHSPECAAVTAQWAGRAAAGPQPAAAGRTWLLLPTQLRGGSSSHAAARDGLQQAAGVLAAEYGPRVVDVVLDSDWAVLLRDPRGAPVSAATLDVYGREVVVMDLVATAEQARGQGHNRALLDAVAHWLTEADARNWVVALPSPAAAASPLAGLAGDGGAEEEAAEARRLQRQYSARGFRRLPGWQQRAWAKALPGFPELGRGAEASVLMVQALPAAAAKGRRRGGEERGEEGGEGVEAGRRRGGAVVGLVRGVAGGLGGAVRGLWGYVTLGSR
ncbi:hypothetical protein HXX76_005394 [Chlamydomonas incerta]|uniref:N-acetyltransferase domain-containing protein n=1 Tax=Chlamydomonas incerta TaxID=51695 RepID=A0A835W6D9_CHLIN|nr:hypothetical protein HXX76_005394 [Chlamydomonas incerta]|eukprot:KAG2438854.1 hypothetical protein HXX76_005394 [Chlamydomonas incerta]